MARGVDYDEGTVRGMRLGRYELGRTLGEGNFGKVKHARHVETGQAFAVKILDKDRIKSLKIDEQIKREIGTLKLLKHPNIVRLYEVLASKTKIYMVLECVNGGELFDKIAKSGKLPESEGRKLFQQLIDAVSYCHDRGVYHRDLKPENVLVDSEGNIKISDFGLSASPQHLRDDGLLHTTCGSPNYVAPEVLLNRGYNGATSDIWSCGVILYVILTGCLPFDDRNLAVLYQKIHKKRLDVVNSKVRRCLDRLDPKIDLTWETYFAIMRIDIFKSEVRIPRWLSPGAKNMIRRILDPNPKTRINVEGILAHEWFKKGYTPAIVDDGTDVHVDTDAFPIGEQNDGSGDKTMPSLINAFELIGMSSSLDLSGFFEKEDVSERKNRFTTKYPIKDVFQRIDDIATAMDFQVQSKHGKLKLVCPYKGSKDQGHLSVAAEVFELSPPVLVVELRKLQGDASLYRELCRRLSDDLGKCSNELLTDL